jgi:sarcosine oxidase subunit alpha
MSGMTRLTHGVRRDPPFEVRIDGEALTAAPGETLATVLLAAGRLGLRRDGRGNPRGLFCNMGTCCECVVTLVAGASRRRVRACLTDAAPGMIVSTKAHDG